MRTVPENSEYCHMVTRAHTHNYEVIPKPSSDRPELLSNTLDDLSKIGQTYIQWVLKTHSEARRQNG